MDSLIGQSEIDALEARVGVALGRNDLSGLNVVGAGEVTLAFGWPVESPTVVCKRMPPMTAPQIVEYRGLVADYVDRVRALGIQVLDTDVMVAERTGRAVCYLVQPALDSESIGNNVLRRAAPDADHPLLVAVADLIPRVTDRLSIDAQVANFAWDGHEVTLVDVGTPFVWDASGRCELELAPYRAMIPAPARALMERDLRKVIDRWRDPRKVGVDVVANLLREGLDDWAPAAIDALNRTVGSLEPIRIEEAQASLAEDKKMFPLITKLQRIERLWQTKIRHRPYDFFIHSSFSD